MYQHPRRSIFQATTANTPKLFLVLFSALSIGCSDTTLTRISVDEPLGETTVQGVGFGNILPLTLSELNTDITQQEAYQQEEFDYVTEIMISSMTLTVTESSDDSDRDAFEDGNEDNFDFIEEMELYIRANISGETRKERIAFLSSDDPQIATATRNISLSTTGLDILEYVEAEGGYEVIVEGNGNVPPDDVIFDGEVVYRVGVGFR